MIAKIIKPFNGNTLKVYTTALIAALTAGAVLLGINTAVGITNEAPRITIGDNATNVIIVPSVGEESYPVEAFCRDPETTVRFRTIPGSETGVVYELSRTRDGVPELITWNTGADGSNRLANFDWNGRGVDEPMLIGEVTPEAQACIEEKAGE